MAGLEYTENPLTWAPANSSWISVTPNNTAYANSNWFEVIASASGDLVLAAIVVGTWSINGAAPYDVEFDVGVGAAASEVVIATHAGLTSGAADNHVIWFPVPIDAIPSGSRVSIRMRKEGTGTTAWLLSIGYYTKPLRGNITTYTGITKVSGTGGASVAATSSATPWANPASWTAIENAPADLVIGGIHFYNGNADTEVEVDIGTGGVGSEVVLFTVRKNMQSSIFGFTNFMPFPILYDGVASGTRIAFRPRASGASQAVNVRLLYYPKPFSSNRRLSSVGLTCAPAASTGVTLTVGNSWAYGAWVELLAASSGAIQLVSITADKQGTAATAEEEIEIGIGAAASEVGIGSWRTGNQDTLRGAGQPWMFPIPIDSIPNNSRVAARARQSTTGGSTSPRVSIQYYPGLPNVASSINKPLANAPVGSNGAAITPTTDWADSAWVELIAAVTGNCILAGISYVTGTASGADNRFEIDIGVGASSSEVVLTTFRGFTYYFDFGTILLPVGHKISSGARVSARLRKQTTGTNNNWTVSPLLYNDVNIPGGGAGAGKGQGGNNKSGGGAVRVFVPQGATLVNIGNAGVSLN